MSAECSYSIAAWTFVVCGHVLVLAFALWLKRQTDRLIDRVVAPAVHRWICGQRPEKAGRNLTEQLNFNSTVKKRQEFSE